MDSNDESMPEPKRRKVTQDCDKCYTNIFSQNFSDQTFEKLPDAIIEKILEFLPLKELAQMSLTCHKFQDAARNHFELKRQCRPVEIDTRLRHPRVKFRTESTLYRVRFRSVIPHVKLTLHNGECVADAFKFINDNCHKRLKILEILFDPIPKFNIFNEVFSINEGDVFAEQLKDLEYLVLKHGIRIHSLGNIFPNLRALCISRMRPEDEKLIFNQKFAKLRTLEVDNLECDRSEFEHFLQNNTQLENIYCRNANTIRGVFSTKTKLSNAILAFERYCPLEDFLDDLEDCSNRKNIDSIHIVVDFMAETLPQRLSQIENVKSVHSRGFTFLENINSFTHVQRLCLMHCFGSLTQHNLNAIVRGFPNLEELCLGIGKKDPSPKDLISFIIGSLLNLKYFCCGGVNRQEIDENIPEWNAVRSNLEKGPHLTVHFGSFDGSPNAFVRENCISINIGGNISSNCSICFCIGDLNRLIFMENLGSPIKQRKVNYELLPQRTERKLDRYCDECNAKASNEGSSNVKLDRLPIEIVEKIFEFLSPNDLARMSVTCHKFQDAARKYFELKRQYGFVKIATNNLSQPQFHFECEKDIYKIRFRNLIPYVILLLQNEECIDNLLNFIKDNCYKRLNRFEVWAKEGVFTNQIFSINNMDVIAEQVKTVRVLVLKNKIRINLQRNIFSNLNSLRYDNADEKILFNQTFQKLRFLCIFNWHRDPSELHKFLQNNPQLKNIFCDTAASIRCVLSTESKLSHAVLKFRPCSGEIENALDDLQECSNRGNIDSIHLIKGPENVTENVLRRLGQMEHVKSLHLREIENKVLISIDAMPHVQELCIKNIYNESMTQQKLDAIVRCFPNLVKLYIDVSDFVSLLSPKELISSIIGRFPKLKHLYFNYSRARLFESKSKIHEYFQEWNNVRSNLQDVPRLSIHFNYSSNIRLTGDSISIINEIYHKCSICSSSYCLSHGLAFIQRLKC